MKVLKKPRFYVIILLVILVCVVLVLVNPNWLVNRLKWELSKPDHYTFRLDYWGAPGIPVGLTVAVRNGQISQEVIFACEPKQTEYPEARCNEIKQFYFRPKAYSIETIFDLARCDTLIRLDRNYRCRVEYDSEFGYPKHFVALPPPDIMDGEFVTRVSDFHVNE